MINIIYSGIFGTSTFQISYHKNGNQISPWKDINYMNIDGTYNMIVEIPKWTREKMEMMKNIKHNPIKQDMKKGKTRYFKYGPIPFTYGFMPQTWENPKQLDKRTGKKGDDDPLDLIEISDKIFTHGGITKVKVLGVLYMIDEGETDWKIIVVSNRNPQFDKINSLKDVSIKKLDMIKKWFENYKKYKGVSVIIGDYLDKTIAEEIIEHTHASFLEIKK